MGGGAVLGVDGIEKGSQYAALWGASAEYEGGGGVGAQSDRLGVIGLEVLDQVTDRWESHKSFSLETSPSGMTVLNAEL